MSTPKTSMDFTDPTGAIVTSLVSDPSTCLLLDCQSIGERAPCPSEQREGPPVPDFVDLFASAP
jgi:hypothetical protein